MGPSPRVALPLVWLVLVAGCRGATPAPAPPSADTRAVDRLLGLMGDRLALAHEVARSKWATGRPIDDPDREREMLDAVAARGAALGLGGRATRRFFGAQVEAGKLVQRADFERWAAEGRGPFPGAAPLADLRRRIDAVNRELLDALAAARDAPPGVVLDRAGEILRGEGITPAVRAAATAPWREPPG